MSLAAARIERRDRGRVRLEIHSREDAHRFVEVIRARDVGNDPAVIAWRRARDSTWLLLLVAAYLLFYLVSVIQEVFAIV